MKNLGLNLVEEGENSTVLAKKVPVEAEKPTKESKLAIGMNKVSTSNDEIDEDDLLKNENINLNKPKYESCADKPRACANCSCGRKENE